MVPVTEVLSPWEYAARAFEPDAARRRWPTPGHLARYLDHRIVQTPALDLIDQALADLAATPDGRLIITMAPQEGKSERVAKWFPLRQLIANPDLRIITASYGQSLANRNGRKIRNLIETHPELGLRIASDNGAVADWTIDGRDGGVYSVGIGGPIAGRPADLLIIDDPIKSRAEADSEVYRQRVWDWWTDDASARLAPGAAVVLIQTRWHADDLAGRLLAEQDSPWQLLNIPAQANHDPSKGETDVLGREPGQFMVSARGRTRSQWEMRKRTAGSRAWAALYQGSPTVGTGSFFKRDTWRWYEQPLWLVRDDGAYVTTAFDQVIQSWDMTFKATKGTDFVCGQVWGRRGVHAYLLDLVVRRMNFPETCRSVAALSAKWPQSTMKLIEDKANGPAVIAALSNTVGGMVPEEPHGGKEARAAAVTPLVEAGNVWLPVPALAPWVQGFVDEAADFPTGKHNDQVDAMTQALRRLLLQPLFDGDLILTMEDLDDELADFGSYIP